MADNGYDSPTDQEQDMESQVPFPLQLIKRIPDHVTLIANGHVDNEVQIPTTTMQMDDDDNDDDEPPQPFIEISEQPQARGFRFRYECEGPSHGGLQGEKSEKYKKTFPAIKIKNYVGPARVVVSLVTDEVIPRPHAHKLVGKNCNDGSCIVELKAGQNAVTFPNLCIQHVTRRKASEVIQQRIMESMKLDKLVKIGNLNAEAELSGAEIKQAKEQAEKQAKEMQLNVVKLCFQAYLRDDSGQFSRLLQSVLSNPIYDSKSPGANALKICRMDKYGGCCTGNEEVFLLCEKVQKDDIAVRFVEQDDDGDTIWEAFGNFGPFDVHRQYAIVFKTPPYRDQKIERAVNVFIMLQRKSDGESSDPKSFTYYPQNFDKEEIAKKRKKTLPSYPGPGPSGFGGSGGSGRQGVGGATNGMFSGVNGGLSSFSSPIGNLPVTVNQQDSAGDALRNQNVGRGRGKGKGRPRKPSPTENNDLETDGLQQTYQPQYHTQPIHQNISFQRIIRDNNTVNNGNNHVLTRPVGPPEFNPQFIPQISLSSFPPQSFIQQSFNQHSVTQQTTNFAGYMARGQTSPINMKVGGAMDSPDSGAGDDEVDCALPVMNMSQQISQYNEPVLQKRGDGGGVIAPQVIKQDMVSAGTLIKQKMELQTDFSDQKGCLLDHDKTTTTDSEAVIIEDTMDEHVRQQLINSNKCHASVQTDINGTYSEAQRTALALQSFAATGDIRCLLMAQRFLLAIHDENGDMPLHTAIINNQLEVVHNVLDTMDTLPNAIRHINSYNHLLQTPLHLAVLTNQPGVVDRLLCAGANPTLPDRSGNTPAHLAVLSGANNCLQALLKYLRPGVSKEKPFPELNLLNFDGFSPAHLAAQKENLDSMKLLVHGKANINLPDGKSGRCPLHYSVEVDDLSVSGYLLLEAGAQVNVMCFDGNTPLHIACGRQNVGMVALLIAAGADPRIENYDLLDDSSDDGDNTDAKTKQKYGHTPEDFADDNEKILKVLHGEPYTSMSEMEREAENREYEQVTSMMTSLSVVSGTNSILSSGGLLKDGSDMDQLKYPSRVQLSKILDPKKEGSDWLALSDKLGLRKLVEGIESGHSQTRALLNYYEECGGTIERLVEALKAIGREEAVQVILSTAVNDVKIQRPLIQECSQLDSGVDTRSISSSHRQIEAT